MNRRVRWLGLNLNWPSFFVTIKHATRSRFQSSDARHLKLLRTQAIFTKEITQHSVGLVPVSPARRLHYGIYWVDS